MTDTSVNAPASSSMVQKILLSSESKAFLFQLFWLVIRVIAGGLMIHNGLDKLAGVQGFADNVVSFIGLPYPVFMTYCAAYTEIIGAILLILGFLTRPSAAALCVTMAVAIFFHLKADGLKIAPLETASLYGAFYLFFLVNGPGQFSIDALISKQLDG